MADRFILPRKAISVQQPYPYFIFHKGKNVENRDWRTDQRGWFLVHAGKRPADGYTKAEIAQLCAPMGGIVGAIKITDCVTDMESEWFFGRYGFVIGDRRALPFTPCKGALGFFTPAIDFDALQAQIDREAP